VLDRSAASSAVARRQRQARYRRRQAAGHVVATLELTPAETGKLSALHYLSEAHLEDRRRIAEAIHALIANIVIDG
jgi:hypothetical protein